MNNKQLKKALENFSNGHKLGDVAQFADVDLKELRGKFKELGVTDEYTAHKALGALNAELDSKNPTGGRWEKGGQVEPKLPKPPKPEYKGEFDRNAIIAAGKDTKDIIPLAEEQTFREDLDRLSWGTFMIKWMEFLNISESKLKEQVKKFSPSKYAELFAGESEKVG